MPAPPARLHVIPAIGCDKALVLRRGPTMRVASCLWDRKHGTVELGQWLQARIFEHRSDLSPDGQHMIIYARRGGRSWTAISRAPWLTALAYYPQSDTWFGGGAFTGRGDVFFNGIGASDPMPDGLRLAEPDAYPSATDGFHMGGLFAAMMQARGWQNDGGAGYDVRLSRPAPASWSLQLRFKHGFRSSALLLDPVYCLQREDVALDCPDWEWAEPWGTGLQFASDGCLWFAQLTNSGLGDTDLIHNFNGMTFENVEAPYKGIRQ